MSENSLPKPTSSHNARISIGNGKPHLESMEESRVYEYSDVEADLFVRKYGAGAGESAAPNGHLPMGFRVVNLLGLKD